MPEQNLSDSWQKNFLKVVNEVVSEEKGRKSNADVASLLNKLNDFFWGKFKKPEDIEHFSDEHFFLELAKSALVLASYVANEQIEQIGNQCFELGVRKNKDYGADNILKFGTMGIIVRIGDKLNRINNLVKNKGAAVSDEKEIDTLMDIFNYAVYGIMLSRNVWF